MDHMMSSVHACVEKVQSHLGWGWKECVYREALAIELRNSGYMVNTEVSMPIKYKGQPLSNVHARVDMLLDGHCIVELKVGGSQAGLAKAQQQCKRYLNACGGHAADGGLVVIFADAPGQIAITQAV
tara:strand:+ start:115 stop:495 length:381 start_codon:yes stop_codon:yes gene_type:complete